MQVRGKVNPLFWGLVTYGGSTRVLLSSLSARVFVLDATGSGEDTERSTVPRRTHAGSFCVSAPHKNRVDGEGRRQHFPGARPCPLSGLPGPFPREPVNPFVHPTYSRSAGCWAHGLRTGVALPRAAFYPFTCLPKPEGVSTCFRQNPRPPQNTALWISASCLL